MERINAAGAGPRQSVNYRAMLREANWLPIVVFFVVIAVAFHLATDGLFLTPRNLTLLMRQSAITAIMAMAVSILIIKGEIDLSIGSAVYLCGTVAASLQVYFGVGVGPTLLVTLGVGLLLGFWQGFWTVTLGVPSFVVTLAGLLGFRGIAFYATDAATIGPMSKNYIGLSESFVPV
ncbi:hypothetical protein ASC97_27720 [Rhizobium sp. Root1203]|uniref:ABC transporter permease subunit n=1 Tax=Rhizobium sp. Root1203 TaxID=1736427 RepID=UPI000711030A|nr:hypothetical protein [Rhizobium sp. Root1203]KQV22164.1 hypothetical protein ASC97_27720 [Rhizobium sp. Root1203]